MKRLIAYLQTVDRAWLAIWILIYLGFVILDAFFPHFWGVTTLKMLGIILCVVYAWQKFKKDSLLIIALAFTLLADTLLALDNTSIAGVFTFCFAQFFHTARLKKTVPVFLFAYFGIIIIFFSLSVLCNISPIYAIAAVYGTTLITNVILSIRWHHRAKSVASICAMAGFILFLCCDTCVGLSYLAGTAEVLPFFIHRLANYFAWVFYYPSQVLISNSSTTLVHHTDGKPHHASKKGKSSKKHITSSRKKLAKTTNL
ncbi:hypothetical protein IJG78_03550 [Candidatus Saccharibacteria bacterium]|nr:hypothetical protein [Candidatus Saccharibacteria bacterium]